MVKKSTEQSANKSDTKSRVEITEEKMSEILSRARQTVKPIINKEAANEIVSDDLLNFRMKAASTRIK
jgi:DNA replicative helicase MCM subunit Mcm2 (Cdc46/Mcm family)